MARVIDENPVSLTQNQWNLIQQLDDLLAESADLEAGLRSGLEFLVKVTNQSGAALYFPIHIQPAKNKWFFWKAPEVWQLRLEELHTPVTDLLTTITDAERASGENAFGLSSAHPILAENSNPGALLIFGPPATTAENIFFQAVTKSFRRMMHIYNRTSNGLLQSPAYLDLLKSRNTLRAMFDNLPLAIYIIDHNYQLIAVNHSRSIRAGEDPRQLVGKKCYEKLYQRNSPCVDCKAADTILSGETAARISREWISKESFQELEINTFPIFDDEDRAIQSIIIEMDVTDKRLLEANLIQSEKLAAVGQLAAGVAHEINNPLTAIIANTQLLQREISADQEDILDSLKLIEMAGTRAAQVVRNLLGIARKEKYEFLPVDLNETLRTSLSLVQHQIVGRPIRIVLNLAENMPEVIASQDQLQGVWINLILNALDALDKEPGEIAITSHYQDNHFHVTVTDNGKGIPSDHQVKVFEPFFTTKSSGRGTGLGLSVCSRVLRHHGGNICVDSETGKWTRFTVTLPGPK